VRYVANKADIRNAYNIFVGKLEWKTPTGRRRLRWEQKSWPWIGSVVGPCGPSNKHLGSIKSVVFLDWMSNYSFLKKKSAL
jgi:hypothetical protein